jgi:hypothetical protein
MEITQMVLAIPVAPVTMPTKMDIKFRHFNGFFPKEDIPALNKH